NPAAKVVGAVEPKWSARTKRLSTAVHLANRNIFKSAEANEEQRGMGATLTAVWIDDARLSVAHVGDSRAYLLRGGGLLQLTRDHSLVAEQVRRGILTAAEAEEIEMPKLSLMFENKIVKEVSVGTRPVTIGRSPETTCRWTISRCPTTTRRFISRPAAWSWKTSTASTALL